MIRTESILTGKENLEHLHTFYDFPTYVGCVENLIGCDTFSDMTFDICKDTGIIQLRQPLPLDVVYKYQHNDGIGQTWTEHYESFCEFLHRFNPRGILEIGAANGQIAQIYTKNYHVDWMICEPNPIFNGNDKITVEKRWFDNNFDIDGSYDAVVHTHVLEHIYNPIEFLNNIHSFLKDGDRHIFSVPNMFAQLKNKYTNCLNFEHTLFLTEDIIDHILTLTGFEILKKEYFYDHSIFYSTVKTKPQSATITCQYDNYKEMFNEFVRYYKNLIYNLNIMTRRCDKVYLFGAHVFSQFLLNAGLNKDNIVGVLDNSPLKQGKRLYGTNLIVQSPEILKEKKDPIVILKAAGYRDEIFQQLRQINHHAIILE